MIEETILSVEENSASAPGDLPKDQIRLRYAMQAQQFRHDNHIRPLAPSPADAVTITAVQGMGVSLARAELWYTTNGRLPDEHSAAKLPLQISQTDWQPEAGLLTHWMVVLPPQLAGTIVRYRIAGYSQAASNRPDRWAHDGHGFWFHISDPQKGIITFAYQVEERTQKQPAWLYDAVIYQIFLDRFHTGNENGRFPTDRDPNQHQGGTIKGVTQSLPYLAKLGVNALWLSPISPSETYHRYDATDYFNVDPTLGSNDDLKALIEQAHALQMRVVLDFVPSHCSWRHPAFVAAQQDKNAPEADWFVFEEWPDKYRSFLNMVPILPSFDTNSASARDYIIRSACHWLTEFGFDGLRLDHTIAHGTDFWVQFRAALQQAKPEAVTIAEATDTTDALRNLSGRIDDVLDFPLAHALRMTFGTQAWSLTRFDNFLTQYEHYMADGPERVSFLDNHDMNRFLFVAEQDIRRLKLAAVCQFTLTPTPTIYYGTEIGMSQTIDKDALGFGGDSLVRENMIWEAEQWNVDLHKFYQELIALRLAQPALRYGTREMRWLDEATGVYGYAQIWDEDELLIVLNMRQQRQKLQLPENGRFQHLFSSESGASLNGNSLTLSPQTAVVLKRE